jgi:hypothetical protein
VVTLDEVCGVARSLPRSYEAVVHGRVKFRVGSIVWLAFSRDETVLGFAFPKEWRQALVDSNPGKFVMPGTNDLRYNWAEVRLAAIDGEEMRDLVVEAWSMVVPNYVVSRGAPTSSVRVGLAFSADLARTPRATDLRAELRPPSNPGRFGFAPSP